MPLNENVPAALATPGDRAKEIEPLTEQQDTRIEQAFHKQMWKTANASSSVERAVKEGRELAYVLRKLAADGSGEEAMAENWLEQFGRDPLREPQP